MSCRNEDVLAMLHGQSSPPQCPKTSPDDIIGCLGEDTARPPLDTYGFPQCFDFDFDFQNCLASDL